MRAGAMLSFGMGILGPVAMLAACVCEFVARRLAKKSAEKEKTERFRQIADVGLVAAWLFLAGAYLCFQSITPDAAALQASFEGWMTAMIAALVVLDILYLFLRRSRPRPAGKKKQFWEI